MAGNGVLEWWRNATPEQKAQRRAVMKAEQEAGEAEAAARQARYRADYAQTLTDEGLAAVVESDTPTNGIHPRVARVLVKVPYAFRAKAVSEAHTRQNLMGGILSDQVHSVVCDMQALIARVGAEAAVETELYGARVAREDRERQQAEREARLAVAVKHAARQASGS